MSRRGYRRAPEEPQDAVQILPEAPPRVILASDVQPDKAARCVWCYAELPHAPARARAWDPQTCCGKPQCRREDRINRARLEARRVAANTIDLSTWRPRS